jgi:hypothetical protein
LVLNTFLAFIDYQATGLAKSLSTEFKKAKIDSKSSYANN